MAPESAGTGGPCESYHRCPGCGRCCCRCRRRPLEDPGPAGVIVTATAGGTRIPAAGPVRFPSGILRQVREGEHGIGKASPERWEGEPLLPRSGRHPDQPVRKSS